MGVEIIQDDPNPFGVGIAFIDQPFHVVRKVVHRALLRHRNMPPTRLRFTKQKEITGAVPFVFILIAFHLARPGRYGRTGFLNQLFIGLVEVDFWTLGVVGLGVEVEKFFPLRDKLGTDLGETPLFVLPRLEVVFLSNWRTVSWERGAANPNVTASVASKRKVHRSRPVGAGLHVTAIRWASALPVRRGGAPVRRRSVSAPRFSSTNRWRVRSTVPALVATSSAISSSLSPSSAFNKMRARVTWRAPALPARMMPRSVSRSSAVKSTRYFWAGIGVLPFLRAVQPYTRSKTIHQNFLD